MAYVALQPMGTSAGREVGPGDVLPEATQWPNLRSWVNRGFIAYVEDGKEKAFTEALRSGDDALKFAPLSQPHHVAAAARRLQHGAGAQPTPSRASGPAPSAASESAFRQAVGKRQKDG